MTGKDYFPEAEIWYILEAIMNVEKKMLERMRVHGDIRSVGIFISDDGNQWLIDLIGVAKFVDTNLTGYKQNAYVKTLLGVSKCPLAPEQLKSLQAGDNNPKHDSQSTEAWAIGLVMLNMGNLSSDEVIYNRRDFIVDKRGLDHLLNQIKERYSPLFFDMVSRCLDFDPLRRPKLNDILGYIAKRKSER